MNKRKFIVYLFRSIIIMSIVFFSFQYYKTKKEISFLKQEEKSLKIENEKLKVELDQLKVDLENSTSLEFIERAARKMGMIRPKEIQIIDLDKDKNKNQ